MLLYYRRGTLSSTFFYLGEGITSSLALHAAGSATVAPASLFWKGKGFALAETGDTVETLSRDKTTGVLR